MNPGQILSFLWTAAALFFLISFVALPISLAMWRKREKRRAADTEATLKTLGFDRSNAHIWDA